MKLIQYGFMQSINDHCLFTKGTYDNFMALLVYIDDVLITDVDENAIVKVK